MMREAERTYGGDVRDDLLAGVERWRARAEAAESRAEALDGALAVANRALIANGAAPVAGGASLAPALPAKRVRAGHHCTDGDDCPDCGGVRGSHLVHDGQGLCADCGAFGEALFTKRCTGPVPPSSLAADALCPDCTHPLRLHNAKGCPAVFSQGDECLCGFDDPVPEPEAPREVYFARWVASRPCECKPGQPPCFPCGARLVVPTKPSGSDAGTFVILVTDEESAP
jgi:hypothetical protein